MGVEGVEYSYSCFKILRIVLVHMMPLPAKVWNFGRLSLDLSTPQIMGILNVTPDSFSDGGQYTLVDQAVAHALAMCEAGASVIDIGGESTRPDAAVVSIEEEIQRVIPVVSALAQHDVIMSIDTSNPELMRAAVEAGAHIWNDVRGLKRPGAIETAVELDVPVILMHMRGEPATMNGLDQYQDVVQDVMNELMQRVECCIEAGMDPEKIMLDPGFGFAKNTEQNLHLLHHFHRLNTLGFPLMSALSRKRFISATLGGVEPAERDIASAAAHLLSIQQGACMVRSHNVRAMHDVIQIWKAVNLS